MISGTVDNKGVPYFVVSIAGKQWRAVVDTGFNGDLELPETLRVHFRPRWLFKSTALLAAGVAVTEDVYAVDFPFDGKLASVEATFAEGEEILVGTRLLRRYCLSINFVRNTVHLERV